MNGGRKGSVLVIVLIIVVVALVATSVWYFTKPAVPRIPVQSYSYTGWGTYADPAYNVSFQYPPSLGGQSYNVAHGAEVDLEGSRQASSGYQGVAFTLQIMPKTFNATATIQSYIQEVNDSPNSKACSPKTGTVDVAGSEALVWSCETASSGAQSIFFNNGQQYILDLRNMPDAFDVLSQMVNSFAFGGSAAQASTTSVESTSSVMGDNISVLPTSNATTDYSGWGRYTNASSGFGFKYPPDFTGKPYTTGLPLSTGDGVEVLLGGASAQSQPNTPDSDISMTVIAGLAGTSTVTSTINAIMVNPGECGGTTQIFTTTVEGVPAGVDTCLLSPQLNTPPQYILFFDHGGDTYTIMINSAPSAPTWIQEIADSFTFSTPVPYSQFLATSSAGSSITISSPGVGMTYQRGETVPIKWDLPGITASNNTVFIVVSDPYNNEQAMGRTRIGNPVLNDGQVSEIGTYNWTIPSSTASGTYQVFIYWGTKYAESNSFEI